MYTIASLLFFPYCLEAQIIFLSSVAISLVCTDVDLGLWRFDAGIGGLELEQIGEQRWIFLLVLFTYIGMGNRNATLHIWNVYIFNME